MSAVLLVCSHVIACSSFFAVLKFVSQRQMLASPSWTQKWGQNGTF